jgi:hypothetical protein
MYHSAVKNINVFQLGGRKQTFKNFFLLQSKRVSYLEGYAGICAVRDPHVMEVLPSELNSGINWIGTAPGLASVLGQKCS